MEVVECLHFQGRCTFLSSSSRVFAWEILPASRAFNLAFIPALFTSPFLESDYNTPTKRYRFQQKLKGVWLIKTRKAMASSSGLGHDQVRRGAKYELSSLTSGDAQDFDELSIGVQDSQTKHPLQSYFQPAKRFSASAEEFVEADLAKGFAWPVNKLAGPRPVMERPHQRPAHHRLKRPLARPSSLPQGHGTSQPTDFSPSSFRPRAPLHLPELGIGGGSSADGQYDPTSRSTNHPEVGSQGEFSPSGSPIRLMPSSKEQPEQPEQPEQTFKPPPDSRISTCSTTEQIGSSTGSDYAEAGAIEWHDFEGLPAKADVGRGGDLAKSQHTANSPGLSESKRQGPKNSRAERLNESQPSTPVQLGSE